MSDRLRVKIDIDAIERKLEERLEIKQALKREQRRWFKNEHAISALYSKLWSLEKSYVYIEMPELDSKSPQAAEEK